LKAKLFAGFVSLVAKEIHFLFFSPDKENRKKLRAFGGYWLAQAYGMKDKSLLYFKVELLFPILGVNALALHCYLNDPE